MSMAGYMSVESKVSISWQIVGYVLMTAGELCISVVGLQLAFEEAPNSMKSMITGIWLCMVSLGNVLASQLVSIYAKTTPGNYFGLMTAMIVVVMILFYFVGRRFEHGSAKAV
jgi:POT family proton-dependent oligopeptide transporter